MLGFVIKLRNKKPCVCHVDFEFVGIVVALYRQFRKRHRVADVHDASILKPLYAPSVVGKTRPARNLGNLEFFVFLRELRRYVVENVEDASLIKPFSILPHVVAIVVENPALNFEYALKCL